MRLPSFANNYGDTSFVTGLRAWAALGVVLIHAGGAGLRDFGTLGNQIVDLGKAGVYVFFVISGFSVSASYIKQNNFFHYIANRYLRIAPLFYFWIAFIVISRYQAGIYEQTPLDVTSLLWHMSLTNFVYQWTEGRGFIGVEWSLPIEFFFYFLVPVILLHVRGLAASVLFTVVCFAVSHKAGLLSHLIPFEWARQNPALS